jgi:hypothetical protein
MPFLLTFPVADVPEPDPKGILLGVLAPVKESALAMIKIYKLKGYTLI